MSWNGSGTFSRTNGTYSGSTVWAQDEAADVDIEAARHDNHDEDLAQGINACLAKNGENAMTGDLDLGSNDIVNAGGAAFSGTVTIGGVEPALESITITAGTGLTGGGDLSANRTIAISHLGIQSLADPNADRIMFWDDSEGATKWLSLSGLTITADSLAVDAASDSAAGKVELATSAEAITGTDTARAVTPAGLSAAITEAAQVKAWVNFDANPTVSIREDLNVSSITDGGTGNFTVNFTSALSDANYAAIANYTATNTASGTFNDGQAACWSYATGSVRVFAANGGGDAEDPEYCSVVVIR